MCRYSFGTAVQVLPIPELMPFRLTRQMVGVMQPHDAVAMLQAPCTLALTGLRSGKDILQVDSLQASTSAQTCARCIRCITDMCRHSF